MQEGEKPPAPKPHGAGNTAADRIFAWLSRARREEPEFFWLANAAVIFAAAWPVFAATGREIMLARLARATAELKSSSHAIQLAVERYAVDNEGLYPADLDELVRLGYMDRFPPNPYYGLVADAPPVMDQAFEGTIRAGQVVYAVNGYRDRYVIAPLGWWAAGKPLDLAEYAPDVLFEY
ncbi:MAG: hypothetical protein HRF49_10215 [bacterium]|jgi:hypothetical protein